MIQREVYTASPFVTSPSPSSIHLHDRHVSALGCSPILLVDACELESFIEVEPILCVDVHSGITFFLKFLCQVFKLLLIFRTSLLKGERSLFDFVILMRMQVLQVVFEALTTILRILQLGNVVLKLFF